MKVYVYGADLSEPPFIVRASLEMLTKLGCEIVNDDGNSDIAVAPLLQRKLQRLREPMCL